MQSGYVRLQMLYSAAVFGFGPRQHPSIGIVAEIGIGQYQVWIIFIRGNLGQVILEHPAGLAQGNQDSNLAVGIVVRHQGGSPKEDIVGAPHEGTVELVVHYFSHRGGVDLAWHEWLIGWKGLVDAEVETVVVFLAEMQTQDDYAPCHERGHDYDRGFGA